MPSKSLALFHEMGEGITHGPLEIWVTPAKGWSSFKMRKIAPETDLKAEISSGSRRASAFCKLVTRHACKFSR